MNTLSAIMRIIEGARTNDVDKSLRYALAILPEEEHEVAELMIREAFDPDAPRAVMDYLDNKIAKATPKFKDTDTEQFIRDVRGGDDTSVYYRGYYYTLAGMQHIIEGRFLTISSLKKYIEGCQGVDVAYIDEYHTDAGSSPVSTYRYISMQRRWEELKSNQST